MFALDKASYHFWKLMEKLLNLMKVLEL
jgi:hypothetical protein